jgi:hypothetical protein
MPTAAAESGVATNCNPARASNVQKPAGSDDAARAGTSEALRLDRMIGRVRHSFEQSVLVAEQGAAIGDDIANRRGDRHRTSDPLPKYVPDVEANLVVWHERHVTARSSISSKSETGLATLLSGWQPYWRS